MKTIETKFVGQTNSRQDRIFAKLGGIGKAMIFSYNWDLSEMENHVSAAKKMAKMAGWDFQLVAGQTEKGYVFTPIHGNLY